VFSTAVHFIVHGKGNKPTSLLPWNKVTSHLRWHAAPMGAHWRNKPAGDGRAGSRHTATPEGSACAHRLFILNAWRCGREQPLLNRENGVKADVRERTILTADSKQCSKVK